MEVSRLARPLHICKLVLPGCTTNCIVHFSRRGCAPAISKWLRICNLNGSTGMQLVL